MTALTRALAVVLALAVTYGAAPEANGKVAARSTCRQQFTAAQFDRDAKNVYEDLRRATWPQRRRLRHERLCAATPRIERQDALLWTALKDANHARRRESALPPDYAAWAKVAICESNASWEIFGSVYPDPLGITAANWSYYGQRRFGREPPPETPTSSASMQERIVAVEIGDEILRDTHTSMPDQNGCSPGGW